MHTSLGIYTLPLLLLLTACAQNMPGAEPGPHTQPQTREAKQRALSMEPRHSSPAAVMSEYDAMEAERYALIKENRYLSAIDNPRSTFAVDVDTAAYSNIRRMLLQGRRPPVDAVRIEEMVNYFRYDYPQPQAAQPFSVTTEVAASPWNPEHKLVLIGIQGKLIPRQHLPPANLVFLIDVSGSMQGRLGLVKSSLRLLVQQMRPQDRIAIVVYAGAAGLVLPSTSGEEKERILAQLDALQAGGSTAGGAGIHLAYQVAEQGRHQGGNNRIILVTDGDFNVGPQSESQLYRLIEAKRKSGIALTVLGVGMGNYKDANIELLADKGNGNYAYIDSLQEARKVLVSELGATLLTIARDVKIQVQFNPSRVKSYRLIGYENRMLDNQDFTDDSKDAGEIGAGHSVTALYEVVPQQTAVSAAPHAYVTVTPSTRAASEELMTVKIRYIPPQGHTSIELSQVLTDTSTDIGQASENLRFASAVAEFGLLLRNSPHRGQASRQGLLERARAAKGKDAEGYRDEFIRLVQLSSATAGMPD